MINLIGLGLGPTLTGMLSDGFNAALASGGHAQASGAAQGLRYALCVMTAVNLWSAFHYLRGARFLREDLEAARRDQATPS